MAIWLCRAGRIGEYETKFMEEKRIYCTWDNIPVSLDTFSNKQDLQQYFLDNDADLKLKTAINWTSQVWPFGHEMKKDEWVILPSKTKPVIHFGKIIGEYEYNPNEQNPFYHSRKVDWFALDIPKAKFEQDIIFSLGAFMTICRIKQEDRIKNIVNLSNKTDTIKPVEPINVFAYIPMQFIRDGLL